jgi:hypothetical protein
VEHVCRIIAGLAWPIEHVFAETLDSGNSDLVKASFVGLRVVRDAKNRYQGEPEDDRSRNLFLSLELVLILLQAIMIGSGIANRIKLLQHPWLGTWRYLLVCQYNTGHCFVLCDSLTTGRWGQMEDML